ncbi:MAG: ATP-binding protein [Chloroflexota bacterium]
MVVEDNPGDVRLVREILKEADPDRIKVISADRLAEAKDRLSEEQVDIILLDLSLPDAAGLETLERMQSVDLDLPIVVLTGDKDEALALQAVRAGAQDYLLKQNLDNHILTRVIRYAIERKRAEVVLRSALMKEKELNELKSRFVTMISHDLRTPLAMIQSSSDLLNKYSNRMTDERKEKHITTIDMQIKYLTRLLEDMLSFGQAESVGLTFNPVETNISVFCQSIVDEMQQIAGSREIRLDVSPLVEYVEVDPSLLRRALVNLLSNAVKYSPEGSVIQFSVSRGSEPILLRIQNEGIGIPEEELPRLFEVFHRAKNIGTIPGTGLGLAIVKQAVEAHGGTISVESHVNAVTAFTISIPPVLRNL